VTNATVNAAISEDPAASRTAMGAIGDGDNLNVSTLTGNSLSIGGFPVVSPLSGDIWQPGTASGWTGTLVGSGSALNQRISYLDIITGAASPGSVLCSTIPDGTNVQALFNTGTTATARWGSFDFSKEVWFSTTFVIRTNHSTFAFRGHLSSYTTGVVDLAVHGFGFKVENLALRLTAHNGTTYAESTNIQSTLATDVLYTLVMRKTAGGVVSGTLNGSALPDTLSGASTSSTLTNGGFYYAANNGATASAGRVNLSRPTVYLDRY